MKDELFHLETSRHDVSCPVKFPVQQQAQISYIIENREDRIEEGDRVSRYETS